MTREMKLLRRRVKERRAAVDKALDNHIGKGGMVRSSTCVTCNTLSGQLRSLDFVLELTSVKPFGPGNPNLPSDFPIEL